MSEQTSQPKPPVSLSETPAQKFHETNFKGEAVNVYRQPVDRVSLAQLMEGSFSGNGDFPANRPPHEVSFMAGGKAHRIWSAEPGFGRVNTTRMILEAATQKDIPVIDLRKDPDVYSPDYDQDYWVHVRQAENGGPVESIQLFDGVTVVAGPLIEESQPYEAGNTDRVSHLQVAHYEGEER